MSKLEGHRVGWPEPIDSDFDYMHYDRPHYTYRPEDGPPKDVLPRTAAFRNRLAWALVNEEAKYQPADPYDRMESALAAVLGEVDE